jgi:hypothetical protein
VVYRTPDGALKERLLNRADEAKISIAVTERSWAFDGEGEMFKLTVEARRIDLAFLFDPMMAVHPSNVAPLPPSDHGCLRIEVAATAPEIRAGG